MGSLLERFERPQPVRGPKPVDIRVVHGPHGDRSELPSQATTMSVGVFATER
jgi:hypothetical protein